MKCKTCQKEFKEYKRNGVIVSRHCSLCRKAKEDEKKLKKKERKETKKQQSEKYLDSLWAKATKIFYGNKCEICGSKERLNSHHIFSRSNRAVRWDIDNCSVLCAKHHLFCTKCSAHKAPIEFLERIKFKRGDEWYNNLRQLANSVKPDRDVLRKALLRIIEED